MNVKIRAFLSCLLFSFVKQISAKPLSPVEFEEPLDVNITVLIESVGDPNPAAMDFELEIILQLFWNVKWELCVDYFNSTVLETLLLKPPAVNEYIQVPSAKVKYFWVPDLYYVEAKDVVFPSQINPPRSLLLYNNGPGKDCRLVFKSKETVTIGCQFDFRKYPLDVNTCYLNMRSFSYPASRLRLHWTESRGVLINPKIQTLVCRVRVSNADAFGEWYTLANEGKYNGVQISFKFSRNITNQLITTYIPRFVRADANAKSPFFEKSVPKLDTTEAKADSILLVLVGFSCFWMSVDAGGERITLTITTLLAVYTQITQVRLSIPPTSYLTNIDIWLFATLGFNLMSTLECALIQGIQSREQKNVETEQQRRAEENERERELRAFRRKHQQQLPFDRNEESEWRDEAGHPNPGTMYGSMKTRRNPLRRQEDQSFTEYCDDIGRNLLIGSFVIFSLAYVVYMVIVNATSD